MDLGFRVRDIIPVIENQVLEMMVTQAASRPKVWVWGEGLGNQMDKQMGAETIKKKKKTDPEQSSTSSCV